MSESDNWYEIKHSPSVIRFAFGGPFDPGYIPFKEGPLDERAVDLLLIDVAGRSEEGVRRAVLDDPGLRKAVRVLAGIKDKDADTASGSVARSLRSAVKRLVEVIGEKVELERKIAEADKGILARREQIDSLVAGLEELSGD